MEQTGSRNNRQTEILKKDLPAQAVGHYLATDIPTAKADRKIGDVLSKIIGSKKIWDELDRVFVLGRNEKVVGQIPFKKLLTSNKEALVSSVMEKPAEGVKVSDDREKAAVLSISQRIESVPVTDENNAFVGVVPANKILEILHLEHVEDTLRSAGIQTNEHLIDVTRLRLGKIIRMRLPWLILGLVGGMLATSIVGSFEKALQREVSLAFFIPVIVYMSDAVGTQTETLFIRGLALGKIDMVKYLLREAAVGLSIGFICSVLLFVFAFLWLSSVTVAVIVGTAMFASISSATFIAVFIPWLFAKSKRDPAFGSGPFATVLQDILSLLIYFLIASVILVQT